VADYLDKFAQAGISALMLTFGKDEYNLKKKGSYFNTHFGFFIQAILLFSVRQQRG
jgi:hypothetical protein